ncbi:MAG: hypothetical protein RR686_02245 [Morganella sp. (in: enterobacteria)]
MKNPKLIVKPFAKNGQKNVIPENYETSMESNQATWDQGFGQITMLPVAAGGLPPKGQDFNGIFNQLSENIVYLSQGGRFKFSAEYAESIGGYPKGAILQSDDEKKEYLSLIDNNKVNFNVAPDISASWEVIGGSYATKAELANGLNKKVNTSDVSQTLGNDLTKLPSLDLVTRELGKKASTADVNGKLTKDQNGADIPDKPKFIENLGLGEAAKSGLVQTTGTSTTNVMSQKSVTDELNKKFDKTGGKITGRVDIAPASGRALTVNQEKPGETSNYMEFYFADVLAAWFGITLGNRLTIANTVAGKSLTIDPDGFKIDGKNIAITDQLLGIGQTYKDVTSSRKNGATYTNNSTKPIIVYVETNRTASSENDPYSIGGDVNGLRVAYRWTTANETMSISFIVPPGASYMFKGGWGQTHSWEPVTKVVELS